MKVSIGSKIVEGPWGGGNLFAVNLRNFLIKNGNKVIYDLSEPDIDLILLTDPRSRSESSSTFNHLEISKYIEHVNPNAVVIQRINECDERKNTKNINNFYLEASKVSDHVIFVSKWLRDIYVASGMPISKTSVIYAGANQEIFNSEEKKQFNPNKKINLVTHHWSSHFNKGFEAYKFIDSLMSEKYWSEKINFTYIGNASSEVELKNSNLIEPLSGRELALELKNHDVYITGSINEPSGNHHIEAAQCGLPIMYIDSGGIPEYCQDYGVSFTNETFVEKLEHVIDNYPAFVDQLKEYPFNSEKMCEEFYSLFKSSIKRKKKMEVKVNLSLLGRYYLFKNKMLNKISFILNIRNNIISKIRANIRGIN